MKLVSVEEIYPRLGKSWRGRAIERVLGLDAINDVYASVCGMGDERPFFERCLHALGTQYAVRGEAFLDGLQTGPLIVTANHPYGGLEAVVLCHWLLPWRPDMKLVANYLLRRIPEVSTWVIGVDPFGRERSPYSNRRPMRDALTHLEAGGLLVMFPSGAVSHWHLRARKVTDPPWTAHVAALVKHSRAPVLPVYVHGRNSVAFQLAGLIHPMVRTALLPRELVNKRGRQVRLTVGKPMSSGQLLRFEDRERMTAFVRASTYLLGQIDEENRRSARSLARSGAVEPAAVAEPVAPETLEGEIATLPGSAKLLSQGGFEVYVVRQDQAPQLVREIGRLREITFREIGEGTGNSLDLDEFDTFYDHLFLWSPSTREIVGAYRLAKVDEVIAAKGREGLYTASLFRFKSGFLDRLDQAIELGRSFIVARHQKQRYSLMLLWCGIARYILRNPRYHTLFGPVSMSSNYTSLSKQLLVWFVKKTFRHPVLAKLVRANRPFKGKGAMAGEKATISNCIQSIDDVSALISELEEDGKGVPVLFKQYLRMNALFLSFSVDEAFSSALDGLILADLRTAEPKVLRRYFGDEGLARFQQVHGLNDVG